MWKIRGKNSSSSTNFESLTSCYVLQVGSTGLSHSHLLNLIWKKSFQLIIPNNKIKNWKIIIWDPQSTHADPKLWTSFITSTFSAQNLVNLFTFIFLFIFLPQLSNTLLCHAFLQNLSSFKFLHIIFYIWKSMQ